MTIQTTIFEAANDWFSLDARCRWFRLEIDSHCNGDWFWLPRFGWRKSVIRAGYNWQTEHWISWLTGSIRISRVVNKPYP
jgi:hypothetical protein